MSPVSHHTSHPARTRTSPRGSPDPDQEVADEVRRRVAKRMRQLPTLSGTTADKDSSSDDEDQPALRCRCKILKSVMDRTGATPVLNKIPWPYEVVYTSDGKPASYQDISIPQFIYGYLLVMGSEEADIKVRMASHLKHLMSDACPSLWLGLYQGI